MKKFPQVRLNKIPLESFMDNLMDLYMGGVEYIDIIGTAHPMNDIINIIVREEYVNEDFEEEDDINEFPLTDETLNLLI